MKTMLQSVRIPLLAGLFLACGAGSALAQAPQPTDPAQGHRHAQQWCQDNPERCAELKAKREAKCAENPQKCEEMKQRMEQKRAQCAADPEACKAQKRERMEKHRERLQQACQEKPDGRACERLQKLDQKRDAHGGHDQHHSGH